MAYRPGIIRNVFVCLGFVFRCWFSSFLGEWFLAIDVPWGSCCTLVGRQTQYNDYSDRIWHFHSHHCVCHPPMPRHWSCIFQSIINQLNKYTTGKSHLSEVALVYWPKTLEHYSSHRYHGTTVVLVVPFPFRSCLYLRCSYPLYRYNKLSLRSIILCYPFSVLLV